MARGKRVSEDLRWTIVRMAEFEEIDTISAYTNTSKRQILRIFALFRATGRVTKEPSGRKIGRRRQLTDDDVAVRSNHFHMQFTALTSTFGLISQYLQGCIDQSCDKFLDELKRGLEDICGIPVSLSTVWRALRRCGYTMKKVIVITIN